MTSKLARSRSTVTWCSSVVNRSCFLPSPLVAHQSDPGTRRARPVPVACGPDSCSPWLASFPPPPPPKVALLCSAASSGTTRQSDSSICVHVRRAALRLRGPVCLVDRRFGGLPVLVHVVSRRARVFDHAASRFGSRFCRRPGCCLPIKQTRSAHGSSVIGAQSPGPPMPLSTLRRTPRDAPRKTRGQEWSRCSFP
jgi:hypothetical protein